MFYYLLYAQHCEKLLLYVQFAIYFLFFPQVRYEDAHLLTISFKLEESSQPFQILPWNRPPHTNSNIHTETQILPWRARLIPLFPHLIPVKSCHYRPSPSLPSPHPHIYPSLPLPLAPPIRRNFLPLPRRRPCLSPVPLFSQRPKIYDNKIPDAAKREGWPGGDPRFSHQPLSHFFTHLSW